MTRFDAVVALGPWRIAVVTAVFVINIGGPASRKCLLAEPVSSPALPAFETVRSAWQSWVAKNPFGFDGFRKERTYRLQSEYRTIETVWHLPGHQKCEIEVVNPEYPMKQVALRNPRYVALIRGAPGRRWVFEELTLGASAPGTIDSLSKVGRGVFGAPAFCQAILELTDEDVEIRRPPLDDFGDGVEIVIPTRKKIPYLAEVGIEEVRMRVSESRGWLPFLIEDRGTGNAVAFSYIRAGDWKQIDDAWVPQAIYHTAGRAESISQLEEYASVERYSFIDPQVERPPSEQFLVSYYGLPEPGSAPSLSRIWYFVAVLATLTLAGILLERKRRSALTV